MKDPETQEKIISFFERLVKDKQAIERGEVPCIPVEERGYLELKLGTDIPEEGLGIDGALEAYEHLEKMAGRWKHPMYFGYFPCTISDPALVGGLINSLIPAYNSTTAVNKQESDLETAVMDYMCDLLMLPDKFKWSAGGVGLAMTTTGNSSVLSVHVAKHKKMKELGLSNTQVNRLVGYYPSFAHSHCIKAMVLNGITEIRKLPLIYSKYTENFMIDINVAREWVEEDKKKGLVPFITFAALGATSCCAVDPLTEISSLCKKEGMMMVTDAAYSGVFLRNDKYADIRDAVALSDFYMINLTKTGYCGSEASVLFHSEKAAHLSAFKLGNGENIACNEYKLGTDTKTGILRMFLTFSCTSMEEFGDALRKMEVAADTLGTMLVDENSSRFERFPPKTNYGLLCIRGKFNSHKFDSTTQSSELQEYLNTLNRQLLTRIQTNNSWLYVLGGENNDQYYIRFSCKSDHRIDQYRRLVDLFNQVYDDMMNEETSADAKIEE